MSPKTLMACGCLGVLLTGHPGPVFPQSSGESKGMDARIEKFLNENRSNWNDWNVPDEDGKVLYELILKNHYRAVLEIGTSTGHSAIWMAWALSKTGGKLITIEIDERRYRQALKNFKQAGVEHLIDARLADAHQLVKKLKGPFDLIFSDADKEWYKQYFVDLEAKLAVGGCFAAHNVADTYGGIREFLDYVRALPAYQTTIDRSSSAGISISCKTR